ncbi:hypothetical protein [uncultured Hydrogenophaga sp.]|uniref:hypothetical protein n=1 Tax=uncultured Hydrogenophaga sp. TaxID=199683 RepID=UPI00266036B6|nr:hypothetical protein [uncultured Hydrogenophaga sp.]
MAELSQTSLGLLMLQVMPCLKQRREPQVEGSDLDPAQIEDLAGLGSGGVHEAVVH